MVMLVCRLVEMVLVVLMVLMVEMVLLVLPMAGRVLDAVVQLVLVPGLVVQLEHVHVLADLVQLAQVLVPGLVVQLERQALPAHHR